ncbi:MAG: SBBP repeat-containing protein [Promethearchaeota archaeon]
MKNKKILVILILVFLNLSFLFQNHNIVNTIREEYDKKEMTPILSSSNSVVYEWIRIWGSLESEYAYDMALDSIGNIYLVGNTYNPLNYHDMCVVKFNSSGDYQWNSTWDGGGIHGDDAYAIALDSLGNIYLAGLTYEGEEHVMCVVKFNSSGDYQWNSTWDGGINHMDRAEGIALDSSGNIYLAGATFDGISNTDMCLVKFDNSGQYQWNHTLDGGYHDVAYGITLDSSDNIYLGGYTFNSVSDYDMCVVKFNNSGDYQWNSTWDGGIYDEDIANGIALDSSGNIYLAGYTYDVVSDWDMCLVKFDNSGNYQWSCTRGGDYSDVAHSMVLDSSDNIYLAGFSESVLSGFDLSLVKFNSIGEYQWNHTWDGSNNDIGYGLALDSSENIYLAGNTYNSVSLTDMCLVKYNSAPKIKINTPIQNNFYNISAPSYDISILDSELDTTWYTLDGGITNITFSGSIGNISQAEWDKKGEGLVTINFHANDSIGLEGISGVSVYKDITAPTSSISFTPYKGTNIVKKSTNFTLTADDGQGSGVASIMYKINDGDWINFSTPFDLSDFKSGNFNISYYSIDKMGNIENINSQEVKIPGPGGIPGYSLLLVISLICVSSVVIIKYRNKSLKK